MRPPLQDVVVDQLEGAVVQGGFLQGEELLPREEEGGGGSAVVRGSVVRRIGVEGGGESESWVGRNGEKNNES